MKYMVSNIDRPNNTPVYSIHSYLDSFIFFNEDEISTQENENETKLSPLEQSNLSSNGKHSSSNFHSPKYKNEDEYEIKTLWNMSFDGSCGKTGSGAGVWIHNTNKGHSYKLDFQCTNNIAEYEALLLGLHFLKDLGAKKISVQGDSKLIIRQIKGEYSSKNPRLREDMNASLELLKTFEKYELIFIPRAQNNLANVFSFTASNCQIPHVSEKFSVKVKNRPTVTDNEKYW